MKFRGIDHGIDLPVLRVHDNDRNGPGPLPLHHLVRGLLCVFLDVHVQAHSQGVPGHRLQPLLCGIFHLHAFGIGQGKDLSVPAL